MAITQPISSFYQPVKSSEFENVIVNGDEAEAEAMEAMVSCFMLLFHFLRNVSDYGGRRCGVCVGEVICHKKSSTILSEPKSGPSQSKIPGSTSAQGRIAVKEKMMFVT